MTDQGGPERDEAEYELPALMPVEANSYLVGEQRTLVAQAAAAHHEAGRSVTWIAGQLGLSVYTTTQLILAAGTAIRGRNPCHEPPDRFDEYIAHQHGAGHNATAIGKRIGHTDGYVLLRLAALGLYQPQRDLPIGPAPDRQPDPLPNLGPRRPITGSELDALVPLVVAHYRCDRGIRDIARDLGRSFGFVQGLLDRAGEPRRPRGSRCRAGKGGRR